MLTVVLCNCSPEESDQLAEALVERRLAACVNIFEEMRSVYRWDGQIRRGDEHTLLIKTSRERLDALKEGIHKLHSYDTPEIVSFDPLDVNDAYATWVNEETQPEQP